MHRYAIAFVCGTEWNPFGGPCGPQFMARAEDGSEGQVLFPQQHRTQSAGQVGPGVPPGGADGMVCLRCAVFPWQTRSLIAVRFSLRSAHASQYLSQPAHQARMQHATYTSAGTTPQRVF